MAIAKGIDQGLTERLRAATIASGLRFTKTFAPTSTVSGAFRAIANCHTRYTEDTSFFLDTAGIVTTAEQFESNVRKSE